MALLMNVYDCDCCQATNNCDTCCVDGIPETATLDITWLGDVYNVPRDPLYPDNCDFYLSISEDPLAFMSASIRNNGDDTCTLSIYIKDRRNSYEECTYSHQFSEGETCCEIDETGLAETFGGPDIDAAIICE
jgi:hypothetical protein